MPIKIALAKMAALACVAGIIMAANLPLLAAHEAHVAGVGAKIVDDSVCIKPIGGKICEDGKFEISIKTAWAGAIVYYTVDGPTPECGKSGEIYSMPFKVSGLHTIKAVSCHEGKQSAVASGSFDVSIDYCERPLKINEVYPNPEKSPDGGKNNVSQNALEAADIPKKESEDKEPDDNAAGGIQAKPEDVPVDAAIQDDAGNKDKDGLGGGDGQGRTENGKKIFGDILREEERRDMEIETVAAISQTISDEEDIVSSENASVGSSDTDAAAAISAIQSSDASVSQDLPIAPDGDDAAIEFSLNS